MRVGAPWPRAGVEGDGAVRRRVRPAAAARRRAAARVGPRVSPRSSERNARTRPSRSSIPRSTRPGPCAARPIAALAAGDGDGGERREAVDRHLAGHEVGRRAPRHVRRSAPPVEPRVGRGEEGPLPAEGQRAAGEAVGEAGGRRRRRRAAAARGAERRPEAARDRWARRPASKSTRSSRAERRRSNASSDAVGVVQQVEARRLRGRSWCRGRGTCHAALPVSSGLAGSLT